MSLILNLTYNEIKSAIIDLSKKIGYKCNQKGYLSSNEVNLIEQFPNWKNIKNEIGNGQGSELKKNKNGVIKFNALHSSTALCVNNFAPFKDNKDKFSFLSHSNFKEATFEKKLPTGISTPNLDFYLESENAIIGIESKFIEILLKKLPNKKNSTSDNIGNLEKYVGKNELNYLPPDFEEKIIKYYCQSNEKLYLDVAQLIKHSIGLINKKRTKHKFILNQFFSSTILVYIYWQPINWYDFEIYRQHQREIEIFKDKINQFLSFIPLSYLEFWKMYEYHFIFQNHIKTVKNRYFFKVTPQK